MHPVATEVWWRNPWNYVRELAEVGVTNVAWDRGILHKKNIDPGKFSEWRALLIGDQGTTEINIKHSNWRKSKILYPTWEYGLNPISELEDWVSTNVDVWQEHRVVVTRIPDLRTAAGKQFFMHLQGLQEDNPRTIVHIHGLSAGAFRYLYGRDIRSIDTEPRSRAANGYVHLGNGKEVHGPLVEFYYPKWAQVSNMKKNDLNVPRNCCLFNIRSNLWAAANWDSDNDWSTEGYERPTLPKDFWEGRTHRRRVKVVPNAKPGDMIECNICSLQSRCKMYREGSLCSVPMSEGARIARHFKTNDPEEARAGLSQIMEMAAERTARAVDEEGDEFDPEVSKMVDSLWKKGVEYTKLIQPKTPLVNINNGVQAVGAAAASITGTNDDHQLVAAAVSKLESAGWPRHEITRDQVNMVMNQQIVPAYLSIPAAVEDANVVAED